MESILSWSDQKLLTIAVHYGEQARRWRNKFLGLLPEIHRRKLYEKHHCVSIFEFAKKVAGMSEKQVRLNLNLERRFEDKPELHRVLIQGEVSLNKLTKIASIATVENSSTLTEKVKILPQHALETYARDLRAQTSQANQTSELLRTPPLKIFQEETTNSQMPSTTFILTPEVQRRLQELHEKGIDINEVILEGLTKREEAIASEKAQIAHTASRTHKIPSRYIPQRTRNLLKKEHGTKCSIQTCARSAISIHHTQRFSITKNHDPHYLAPLCKSHHTLAHLADQRYAKIVHRAGLPNPPFP